MFFIRREKFFMLFDMDIWQRSMKGVMLFFGTYIFATLFASILTPPTYWFAEWINETYPSETSQWLCKKGVEVFYDRLRWLPIILAFPFLMKACGLLSWSALGIYFEGRSIRDYLRYFLYGFAVSSLILFSQYYFAGATLKEFSYSELALFTLKSLFGALILGFLEEAIFRGLIMRSFYTAIGATSAIIFSSLFFSYKHFKVDDSIWQKVDGGLCHAGWGTGFIIAYYDAVGIIYTFDIIRFTSYALFGVLLCLMYLASRSLILPIAFHGGIFVSMKIGQETLANVSRDSVEYTRFGSTSITDGYISLVLLALLCVVFFIKLRRRQRLRIEHW